MLVLTARNINDAYHQARHLLHTRGEPAPSRYGDVLRHPDPVTTHYRAPREKVLFDPARDANPFFHLFESLWILAGRNDVRFLAYLNPRMVEFSDDGLRFHGAYGDRLRHYRGVDQLAELIKLLQVDPLTRRAVATIWRPDWDLVTQRSKDLPCNDFLKLDIREDRPDAPVNLTVVARSNDLLWGTYGANAVQWAMVLEYVAAALGRPVGWYEQVSLDWHGYRHTLAGAPFDFAQPAVPDPYCTGEVNPQALLVHGETIQDFNVDLQEFFVRVDDAGWSLRSPGNPEGYTTEFFRLTVAPAYAVFEAYRGAAILPPGAPTPGNSNAAPLLTRLGRATDQVGGVAADDWRLAMSQWLTRRLRRAEAT